MMKNLLGLWLLLFFLPTFALAQSRHRLIHTDLRTASESAQLAISRYCQSENTLYFQIQVGEDRSLPLAFSAQDERLEVLQAREDVSLSWWWPKRYLGWTADALPSKLVRLLGQVEQGRSLVAVVVVDLSDQDLRQYVEALLKKSGLYARATPVDFDRFNQFMQVRTFPTPYATAVGKMKIVAHHVSRTGALEVEPIWPSWGTYRETSVRSSLLQALCLPSSPVRFPLDYLAPTDKAYLLWDTSQSPAELVGYLTQDGLSLQMRFHFPELEPSRAENYFARLQKVLGEEWQKITFSTKASTCPEQVRESAGDVPPETEP
jgi:hypothetical protein